MRDPYVITPDLGTRKRMGARRAKWRAAWAHRVCMTPEELAEEEMRLEAEKLNSLPGVTPLKIRGSDIKATPGNFTPKQSRALNLA